jgi:hypothetical protein
MKLIITFFSLFWVFNIISAINVKAQMPAGHPKISEDLNAPTNEKLAKPNISAEQLTEAFIERAKQIDTEEIARAATQQNGRIKPFDTFARETILFILGRYTKWDLSSAQIYLGLIAFEQSPNFEIVEVRNLELRQKLGFLKSKKYFTLMELESSPLSQIA